MYMRVGMRVRALGVCICGHVHVRVVCVCVADVRAWWHICVVCIFLLRMDRCQLLRPLPITSRAVLSTTDAVTVEQGMLMKRT